jgi:hypothetical protein
MSMTVGQLRQLLEDQNVSQDAIVLVEIDTFDSGCDHGASELVGFTFVVERFVPARYPDPPGAIILTSDLHAGRVRTL